MPIIVTFIEEEILIFEGVPIIPIFKLNSFINEKERGVDSLKAGAEDALNSEISQSH